MTIRPATPNDVPAVLPMVRRICDLHQNWDPQRFTFRGDVLDSYHHWLGKRCDDPRGVFLVAETDDSTPGNPPQLAGYVVGTVESEIPIYWMPECGWIHDIWVEEDYRHEGLGKQLVMLAVERFTQIGVAQVRLQTATANETARRMFADCGFRPATTEMLIQLRAGDRQ